MKDFHSLKQKYRRIVVLPLLLVSGIYGCTLDDQVSGEPITPFQLTVSNEYSLIHFEWNRVNVTGFEEYILLQSNQPIPNTESPELNQNTIVLKRFDDVSVQTFSTANALFTEQTCYKLFCDIGDRFISSASVCVSQENNLISGFFDRITHHEDADEILMFDRINNRLATWNLTSLEVSNSISETQLNFPILDIHSYQGNTAAYAFDANQSRIKKYSFPQLNTTNQRQLQDGIFCGVAAGAFLFVGTQNSQSSFQILDRNTLSTKDTEPGLLTNRNLGVFPGDTTIVLEMSDGGINRYEVNSNGIVIRSDYFAQGLVQPSTQNTVDTNEDYFIGGRLATIIHKDGDVITTLNTDPAEFSFFNRFSPDDQKALSLVQTNTEIILKIFDISQLPQVQLIKSYQLPQTSYADLFVHDNIIHVVGINFNSGSNQTFILKLPL